MLRWLRTALWAVVRLLLHERLGEGPQGGPLDPPQPAQQSTRHAGGVSD
jgi:hypothetical protein